MGKWTMVSNNNKLVEKINPDARDRAHQLFLHGIMSYVNGKIDVFELCDRMIRIDSIIRHVPLDKVRKERKESLRQKILKKFGTNDN